MKKIMLTALLLSPHSLLAGEGTKTTVKAEVTFGKSNFAINQNFTDEEREVLGELLVKHQVIGYFKSSSVDQNGSFESRIFARDGEIGEAVRRLSLFAKKVEISDNLGEISVPLVPVLSDSGNPDAGPESSKLDFVKDRAQKIEGLFSAGETIEGMTLLSDFKKAVDAKVFGEKHRAEIESILIGLISRHFEDGVLRVARNQKAYVRFLSPRGTIEGRIMRSTLNEAIARKNSDVMDLCLSALILETFKPDSIALTIGRSGSEPLDKEKLKAELLKSTKFLAIKSTLSALSGDDKVAFIEGLTKPFSNSVNLEISGASSRAVILITEYLAD